MRAALRPSVEIKGTFTLSIAETECTSFCELTLRLKDVSRLPPLAKFAVAFRFVFACRKFCIRKHGLLVVGVPECPGI